VSKLIKYAIGAVAVVGVYELFLKNRAAPVPASSASPDMGAPGSFHSGPPIHHSTRGAMRPGRGGGGGGSSVYYDGGDPYQDLWTLAKDLAEAQAKGGFGR
jgi:hypothetical protein